MADVKKHVAISLIGNMAKMIATAKKQKLHHKIRRKPLGFSRKPYVSSKKPHKLYSDEQKLKFLLKKEVPEERSLIKNPHVEDSHLNAETLNYLHNVNSTIKHGLSSEKDKVIFAENVFCNTYKGNEITLSKNGVGCNILAFLVPHLSPQNFQQVLEVFQNNNELACTHFQVGKVTRVLMKIVIQRIKKYHSQKKKDLTEKTSNSNEMKIDNEEVAFYKEWFTNIAKHLITNMNFFLSLDKGNFVFNHLLELLQGPKDSDDQIDENDIGNTMQIFFPDLAENISLKFLELLESRKIEPKQEFEFSFLRFLKVLVIYEDLQTHFMKRLFDLLPLNEESSDESHLPIFIIYYNGLIRHLLTVYPELTTEFLLKALNDKLQFLSSHFKGLPLLVKMISSCTKKNQLKKIIHFILPDFPKFIILEQYHPLLKELAVACVRLKFWQNAFIKNLMITLHCFKPNKLKNEIAEHVLCMTPYDRERPQRDDLDIKMEGSLILQQLLQFDEPTKCVESILSMKPDKLEKIALSRLGSHIIEAFLSSKTVESEDKMSLIHALKDILGKLASTVTGVFVINAIWTYANENSEDGLALKTWLAEELTKHTLTKTKQSHFVCRQLGLFHFTKDKNRWIELQEHGKKRKILDIMDSEQNENKPNLKKKRDLSLMTEDMDSVTQEALSDNNDTWLEKIVLGGSEDDEHVTVASRTKKSSFKQAGKINVKRSNTKFKDKKGKKQ